jgi:NAD+ synthase (glutamine-hydrolysing)
MIDFWTKISILSNRTPALSKQFAMKKPIRLYLGQINPTIGDLVGNAKKILDTIKKIQSESSEEHTNIIAFPELSLTGYPPKDLLQQASFVNETERVVHEVLLPQIKTCTLIGTVSKPFKNEDKPFREKQLFNSAVIIHENQVLKTVNKKLLPNYEVFNESRYFMAEPNLADCIFELESHQIAVLICEDLLSLNEYQNLYSASPVLELAKSKPALSAAICLSASPFRSGFSHKRRQDAEVASKLLACPVALVNQVGANDDLIFDGSSFVIDQTNSGFKSAKSFEENILEYNFTPKSKGSTNQETHCEAEVETIREALVLGIKDYFAKTSFQQAFIGLSGGIDSAVVASLATAALGKENVFGILMPSAYSSEGSISDSEELSRNLGIKIETINIQPILEGYLQNTVVNELTLAEENLQARIRGNILMAKANQANALVLATGNKSEFSVGYSTLYGDMCGALAPIGDLWKTQVWALAKTFGEIPKQIISKAPSAELRPGQLDSDSLPNYETLDALLKSIIEEKLSSHEIAKKHPKTGKAEIERVFRLFQKAEHKRKQAPVILKISANAFGSGWHRVISSRPTYG